MTLFSLDRRRVLHTSRAFAALTLTFAFGSPDAGLAQGRVVTVSLAYDHLYRETRDALGFQQVIYRRDDPSGNTAAMRDWTAASARAPKGMSGLVARCIPPVMQARTLLLEGGAIMARHGPPSDTKIVNDKTVRATALLDSVSDCWQSMVAYERQAPRNRRDNPCTRAARPVGVVASAFNSTLPALLITQDNKDCQTAGSPPAPRPFLTGTTAESVVTLTIRDFKPTDNWNAWHHGLWNTMRSRIKAACADADAVDFSIARSGYSNGIFHFRGNAVSYPRSPGCEDAVLEAVHTYNRDFPDQQCTIVRLHFSIGPNDEYDPSWKPDECAK